MKILCAVYKVEYTHIRKLPKQFWMMICSGINYELKGPKLFLWTVQPNSVFFPCKSFSINISRLSHVFSPHVAHYFLSYGHNFKKCGCFLLSPMSIFFCMFLVCFQSPIVSSLCPLLVELLIKNNVFLGKRKYVPKVFPKLYFKILQKHWLTSRYLSES